MLRFRKAIALLSLCSSLSFVPCAFAAVQTPITLNKVSQSDRMSFIKELQKYLDLEDFDSALKLFDTLSSDMAGDFDLLLIKASILFSAGKLDEADSLCSRLLSVQSDNMDVIELRSMIAKMKGDKNQRNASLRQILQKDPKNVQANIEVAEDYSLSKDFAMAKKYYKNALSTEPKNLNALFGYGQTSYYTGDISTAKSVFTKMLEIDEKNASAYAYLGKLEAEDDNYKKAEEYVKKAVEYDENNYDYRLDYGKYMNYRGKKADAEEQWKKAIAIRPDYFLAYSYLAGLYDEQERFEDELEMWKKVVETEPKYYYAYEAMGIIYWHKGELVNCRNSFLKAADYNPKNESYPLMVGATYLKQKDYQKCKLYIESVFKKRVFANTSASYAVLRMYHDNGGGTNAENQTARLVAKETNKTIQAKLYYYLALFYDINGSRTIAEEYYSKVLNHAAPMFFEFRLAEWGAGE